MPNCRTEVNMHLPPPFSFSRFFFVMQQMLTGLVYKHCTLHSKLLTQLWQVRAQSNKKPWLNTFLSYTIKTVYFLSLVSWVPLRFIRMASWHRLGTCRQHPPPLDKYVAHYPHPIISVFLFYYYSTGVYNPLAGF